MKKKIILLLLLLPMMVSAQRVKSVCGAKFGSTYYLVMLHLKEVYGSTDEMFYKNDCIMYFSKEFEGITFDALVFNFARKGSTDLFDGAKFFVSYPTEDAALDARARLVKSLGKTFTVEKVTTPDGYVTFCGGTSPLKSTEYGFQIYITYAEGDDSYTVHLEFGPYGY